eukprot:2266665-Pyramimonas_sp.AAC.1
MVGPGPAVVVSPLALVDFVPRPRGSVTDADGVASSPSRSALTILPGFSKVLRPSAAHQYNSCGGLLPPSWYAHFLPLDPSVFTSNTVCMTALGRVARRP